MSGASTGRREFLLRAGGSAGLAWLGAQWPSIVAAAEHAHQAVKSTTPVKFQVLTPAQARDVEAIAAQIIPTDDLPGAREAGVVYFIDQALKTFASDTVATYQKGLAELNSLTTSNYPGVKQFADANNAQQQALLHEISDEVKSHDVGGRRRPQTAASNDFFQTVWQHTIFGFLVDPSGGGNREFAGWKVIGRDPEHSFAPPFGFYDKDYPGWQKAMEAEEKK
ncbi:MAG TPA: gluconate 2-dehydrogenase subunit 3 family protein [Candidatus Saccharimonadales bacterium]|nr:gluconate 2-dehydrogenase subunit 3 family protein [Candidatus Saccharimonadales bacterium]